MQMTDWSTTCVRCNKPFGYTRLNIHEIGSSIKVGTVTYPVHRTCMPPQWGHEKKDDLNREADCFECKHPITDRYPEGHLRYYVKRTPEGWFPIHEKCRKK